MKRQIKAVVAIALVAAMLFMSSGSIMTYATETSNKDETTGYTTTTWDFANSDDAEDFTFYTTSYHGESEFAVAGGTMNAQYENLTSSDSNRFNVHRKAILNDTHGGQVQSMSVDIAPSGNSGVLDACVFLGVNPGTDGTISGAWSSATDGITIRYRDVATENTFQEIQVTLHHNGMTKSVFKLADATNNDVFTALDSVAKENPAITMSVAVDVDNTLALTIQSKADTSLTWTKTIDLTKTTDDNDTGFEETMLRGLVGVGAWYRGASFDNLSVTYKSEDATTYDFSSSTQAEAFDFYQHKDLDDTFAMTIKDGALSSNTDSSGTSTAHNRKMILNNDYEAIQRATVDIMPATGKVGMRGCMYFNVIGGQNSTNGNGDTITETHASITGYYTGISGLVFALKDVDNSSTQTNEIYLKVSYIYGNGKEYVLVGDDVKNGEIKFTPTWYGNCAEALTFSVEQLTLDTYLCTIRQTSNLNNYVSTIVDLNNLKNGEDVAAEIIPDYDKVGTIGLGTWTYRSNITNAECPAQFDNLIVNGVPTVTVGGMENSNLAVAEYASLPTGADVYDGKYVLGWTMDASKTSDGTVVSEDIATNTYYGTGDGTLTYTYKAKVVDPEMLTVSWQEGVSEKGNGYSDMRFIASLNDYVDYEYAGFIYSKHGADNLLESVSGSGYLVRKTTLLYETLNANGKSVGVEDIYLSTNNYPKYFIAHEMLNNPEGCELSVRVYIKLLNGDYVYGNPVTVTVPSATE